jgi:hypothetical protein
LNQPGKDLYEVVPLQLLVKGPFDVGAVIDNVLEN